MSRLWKFTGRARMGIAALALVLSIVSCSGLGAGSALPTLSPDLLGTTVAGTLQALTPLATVTLPVTQAPATPVPATPVPASRINFAGGATATGVEGQVRGGQSVTYVLGASKNQPMIVLLASPDPNLGLAVWGRDGTSLLAASQKSSSWQINYLPATQDYYIQVIGATADQNFSLSIVVPSRIVFASGATSTMLDGVSAGGYTVSYALHALGGQKMTVKLNAPADSAALTIYGFSDGQPYVRSVSGATEYSMTLPSTQDYIIQVVPQAGQVVTFSLNVKVK